MSEARVTELFSKLGVSWHPKGALVVTSPGSGDVIAQLAADTEKSLEDTVKSAVVTQQAWSSLARNGRVGALEAYAVALRAKKDVLAELIMLEAGKTAKEAVAEAEGASEIILKTIKDTTLPEFNGMSRCKERLPAGVVGLITSFNFPIAVAHWTTAPALLAGNAVVWKPSEKTPLVALACKAIFAKALPEYSQLLQIVIGAREVGQALVAHEQVDVISATGSVTMGQGIRKTLAKKKNNAVPPILELGGNNGVIISEKVTPEHLRFALSSLLNSFFGSTGQRCTNTRRLFVHRSQYDETVAQLTKYIETFLASVVKDGVIDPDNAYGYGPLIDEDAYLRFEDAKKETIAEGGRIVLGSRLFAERNPRIYFVEPALALLPSACALEETSILHRETFAPLLFMVPYDGTIMEALRMLNAPGNAGLVGGIYTLSQKEADVFARLNEAGHSLINSPKGTGTPAFGMGFGGNKESGAGEILNSADPLQAFTRPGRFSRIAQNKDIVMGD